MSDVDKIKERLSLVEVVGSYVHLEKAGSNFKGRCPFHNEKTPSFYISPDRDLYYCFGCGAKGDLFTFVEQYEGVEFYDALVSLADRAGVEISRKGRESRDKEDRLYELLEKAAIYFRGNLLARVDMQKYLRDRGVTDETEETFLLGYASGEWEELITHLKKSGFSDEEIAVSGMSTKNEKGRVYDRFRDRLMFPIRNASGRVVGFSGRLVKEKEHAPKYLNSPETPVFKKSHVLYGFDRAKQTIRKNNFSILVEGQFDLVLSHQAGFPNTVATSGTSVTNDHVRMIARLSKNLLLSFDSDTAGYKSMYKVAKVALPMGMDVKVSKLPEGKDPADVIRESAQTWRTCVRESEHIIPAYTKYLGNEARDDRAFGKKVSTRIVPLIASIPQAIDRTHFVKEVSRIAHIPEEAVHEEVRAVRASGSHVVESPHDPRDVGEDKKESASRIQSVTTYVLALEEKTRESDKELHAEIQNILHEHDISRDDVEKEEIDSMLFLLERDEAEEGLDREKARELLRELDVLYARKQLRELEKKLREAEERGDDEAVANLLQESKRVSKRLP